MAVGSRCTLTARGKDGGVQWSSLPSARIAGGAGQSWGGQRCLLRSRCSVRALRRLRGVGGSALVRESAALLGCWQWRVGVGTLLRQAADALGRAARLRPRVKVGGGQRRLLLSGHVTGGARQKWGGGSGACFACVARLSLVGDGGVLGVVRWWGMLGRQRWRFGGAMALSQFWRQHTGVRGGGTQQST